VVARGKETRSGKKRRRAEKFEELVAALYEFDHWMENLKAVEAYGAERIVEVSPFAKIQAISAVYFPTFDEKIRELDTAAGGYRVWIYGAAQKRVTKDVAGMNDGLAEAYRPYLGKREALLKALKEFAHTEFQ
jgi:hypothetical protein